MEIIFKIKIEFGIFESCAKDYMFSLTRKTALDLDLLRVITKIDGQKIKDISYNHKKDSIIELEPYLDDRETVKELLRVGYKLDEKEYINKGSRHIINEIEKEI